MATRTASHSAADATRDKREPANQPEERLPRQQQAGGGQRESETTVSEGAPGAQEPAQTRGRTSIAGGVVEKIAGMAAREVPGVHALGGTLSRTLGAVRDRVPGGRAQVSRGVKVEVGQRQTAIDLDVMVEYGVPISELAREVRENVIAAVERMTGLEVIEVNIAIVDVRLPDEDLPEDEPRVQ
ncbi:Asp23/Gls24 family envelope stress response protein [Streptomyces triticirhizae]|uniref:Asp23/Gls24 family envelope stress response protein n=1 Tax=Streptomyces triticirhizae TaxID=2483353 RepID=A0A3M2LF50_9ACTN|nr:Asp23/Gls24 family envelope stress response protein [Streptomyces triticirhizae]RMI34605.1 Asp23/Gls24 family envelope stress response protein [Streptomyces triticirhizae]